MTGWNEEPIVFHCEREPLVGILHRGSNPDARLGVLIVVGGPQYRVGSHRQFVLMARDLAASGYPVLRFDYRGMGDSGGEPRTFETVDGDLRSAIATLERALPQLTGVVLWGLCDAASAILMLNPAPIDVIGRILVNPWLRTEASEARAYVRHYYLRRVLQRDFWRKVGSGAMNQREAFRDFLGALWRAKSSAVSDRDRVATSYIEKMLEGARSFHGSTLLVLSGRDLTAREFEAFIAQRPEWRQALSGPRVSRVALSEADHTFSDRQALETGTQVAIRWSNGL